MISPERCADAMNRYRAGDDGLKNGVQTRVKTDGVIGADHIVIDGAG